MVYKIRIKHNPGFLDELSWKCMHSYCIRAEGCIVCYGSLVVMWLQELLYSICRAKRKKQSLTPLLQGVYLFSVRYLNVLILLFCLVLSVTPGWLPRGGETVRLTPNHSDHGGLRIPSSDSRASGQPANAFGRPPVFRPQPGKGVRGTCSPQCRAASALGNGGRARSLMLAGSFPPLFPQLHRGARASASPLHYTHTHTHSHIHRQTQARANSRELRKAAG